MSYYNKDAKHVRKYSSNSNSSNSTSKFPKPIIVIACVAIFFSGIGVANLFNKNSSNNGANNTQEIITESQITTTANSELEVNNNTFY